jgi:hypothetical protein
MKVMTESRSLRVREEIRLASYLNDGLSHKKFRAQFRRPSLG